MGLLAGSGGLSKGGTAKIEWNLPYLLGLKVQGDFVKY